MVHPVYCASGYGPAAAAAVADMINVLLPGMVSRRLRMLH